MTPLAALGFAFFGSIIGFLAGVFLTVAHPIYLKHREDLLKARESRKRVTGALDMLTQIMSDKAKLDYQQRKRDDPGRFPS